ncbi:UDP-N-acetyl-D-mannosamine dehydrogenase [Brevundimonas sp.]|uniref:UDP-N-acetyl-D-mannosamine dehydrogenase n=1 Tax=Brevundimonas sp. TaxID=1871086 RepID=UPI003BAC41B2
MSLTVYADFQQESSEPQRIAVVGLGYIGLPTAVALAQAGHHVVGVDVNSSVVTAVNSASCHIVEPGLDELLNSAIEGGRLSASVDMPAADAYLIAVPTPTSHDGDHQPDLAHVFAATDAIAAVLESGAIVVLESTSPVGATRQVIARMAAARPDLRFPEPGRADADIDIDVVYSPERVIPGKTLQELAANARVLGGATPRAALRAAKLYRSLTRGELLLTDDRSAEMVKLVENSFRDVNIAFANELSLICEKIGLDVWEVIALANHHPRVNILKPGPGVGGHCIAVDPWFIVAQAPEQARLIRTAREVNDSKPHFVMDQIRAALAARPDARVACLGLTFKPDVDDYRESPSLEIARTLGREFPGRVVCADPYEAMLTDHRDLVMVDAAMALAAPIVVGLVAHREFRSAPRPVGLVIDVCGIWT